MSDETVLTVGVGKQYATINAAILAADNMGGNADIRVDAGTYNNDGGYLWDGVNNVTIEGVGGVVKIVDPSYYAGGKAAIVTGGQNILLKNLDISGVTVPDGNGAGVRYDQGTLTLDNVSLHGNQNGILGAADSSGSITIQNSNVYGNGTSAGNTHNIYIGDIANFTLTNSYVHDANVGHEVKSRAENNTITNNVIADNNGTSSYAIDLPNGGNATITGNVIEQGANNQNHIVNAYGEEGSLHAGTAMTFSNNTILNDDRNGAGPLWANNGATITGSGNTAWNLTNLGNGVNPSSVSALSSEPNLAAIEASKTASISGSDTGASGGSGTTTGSNSGGGGNTTTVTSTAQTVLTVGVGKQYATINAAILAADNMGGNADIRVDAGTYNNDGGYLWDGVNNVTIEGVGGVVKIVDPSYYAGGKAAIVTGGQNILLKNLDISGVTVPDGNGAGVRYDQGTLTLDNVSLHGNQNGILGAADSSGSITIQNSNVYGNGTSAGNTHNIYIGDIANFTLTNSYVHDANVGHEVKSRAENNTITNNVIADNNGTSSYAIDLPNGGNATITGNVIEQGANNQNHIVNAYGEEGSLHAGTAMTFSNNTILNDDRNGAGPLWANNGATITGSGNTAWNLTNLGNGVNPSSVSALSSEPNLAAIEASKTPAIASPSTATLHPTISVITGVPYTGVRLTGTADAGSTVTVTDTVAGNTTVLGNATASSTGAWSLMSPSGLGHIDLSAIHKYSVSATDGSGNSGAMPGALYLTDTSNDVLNATAGIAEVVAIMSFQGTDVINGFEASGANHDVLNFSGRGISSFSQARSIMSSSGSSTVFTLSGGKTVTLTDVTPGALTAADFRFS